MGKFSAIVFDMDGLLLDSEKVHFDAFCSACTALGLGDLSSTYNKCIGTNYTYTLSILRDELNAVVDLHNFIKQWDSELEDILKQSTYPVKDGAKALLESIKNNDIPIALATSSNTYEAKKRLADAELSEYFSVIIGGDQVEKSKPAPDIYLQAAANVRADLSLCLALEDSPNGVRSAISASMTVVQIPDLIEPDQELLSLGHIVLNSLNDVITYEF